MECLETVAIKESKQQPPHEISSDPGNTKPLQHFTHLTLSINFQIPFHFNKRWRFNLHYCCQNGLVRDLEEFYSGVWPLEGGRGVGVEGDDPSN